MRKIFLCLILIASIPSFAQDSTKTLSDVMVVSVRADKKTPVTQKTISKEDLTANFQGQEISILLNSTPAITSSSDGGHPQGYTYWRLRGIDQTRINMTLNGVPLNEPEDQGAYTSNFYGFANDIQSVQIQRGVGTSTNGVASYAGSVSYQSQNGLKRGADIQLGYGSFDTKRVSVSNSTGLSKNGFALFTNASAYSSNGYKYHSGGWGYSGFLSGGYYSPKDILTLTAFTGKSINEMAWLAVSESDILSDPKTNYNSDGDKDNFRQTLVQLQYAHSYDSLSKLSITGFYNRLDGNWDLNLNSVGGGSDILNYQLGSNFYGGIMNYSYNNKKVRMNTGISANAYTRKHALAIYPALKDRVYNNTGDKTDFSGFLKLGFDVKRLSTFADLQVRYVDFDYRGDVVLNGRNWKFFNPKAGFIYTFSPKLNLYTSIGKTHREPTRTNMFGGDDNLITFVDVKTEEVVDYELGINYKSAKTSIQSNVYYMRFKNEITPIGPLGANGLALMVNVPKSFRSGLEIDFSTLISKKLSFVNNTSFSHNRMEFNGSKFQQLYSPEVIMNNGLKYTAGNFGGGVNYKYHTRSFINFENTAFTPDFGILGINLSYTYKSVSLLLEGVNLTSKKYFTSGYTLGNDKYFFANAPFSFYSTLKIQL